MNQLDADTLVGDVRDAMLARMRSYPKPWPMLSEEEQQDMVSGITNAAQTLVRKVVNLVATRGFDFAVVNLKEMKIKGGIEMKVTAENVETYRNALGDRVGSLAVVVFADPEEFAGQREEPRIDPDEPEFPALDHEV